MLRLLLAGLLALLIPAAVPAGARAATVAVEDDVIVFRGTGDERNSMTVEGVMHAEYGPMIQLADTDAAITAFPDDVCLAGDYYVTCLYGSLGFRVEAGGGNDFVRIERAWDSAAGTTALPATVIGGAGDDRLEDESGTDQPVTVTRRFEGGDGDDQIKGQTGPDVLLGGPGHDELDGGAGDDELRGEDGDDRLWGDHYDAPGADVLDGGPGNDIGDEWNVPSSGSNPPVTITQDGQPGDGRPGEHDNVISIERVSSGLHGTWNGTEAPDDIVTWSSTGPSVIRGHGGDDSITTGWEREEIDGGAGADKLTGGYGDDRITGGPGADVINSDGGSSYCGYDTCEVPYGNDTVYARDGEVDSVECGVGQDWVEADANDVVAPSCETVERAAAGGGTATTGGGASAGGAPAAGTTGTAAPGAPAAPAVRVSGRLTSRRGVTVTVTCPGACAVRAQLRHRGRVVGTARRAGAGRLTVRLSAAGRARLRRVRRARLVLTVRVGETPLRRTVSYRR